MKKLIIILLFVNAQVWAQTEKPKSTWEVEVDPIAYILKGYSFHGIYQPGRLRFDAGVYGIQIPKGIHGNTGFEVKNQGFTLKAHYLIQGIRGLYAGIGTGYAITQAKFTQTGATDTGHAIGIGPELGYRLFLQRPKEGRQKGLYIAPWIGLSYNFITDKIDVPDQEYKQQSWQFFPTVHIGYRF